ncbi:MAG: endonuclease III [Nanoarchaeota archaeon]|nr:endonuclease III [Nanoarchaeota archaeon]
MNPHKKISQLNQLRRLAKKPKELRLAAESWRSAFQILIATILSARTRDETTIPIAEKLFKKYPNAKSLSKAPLSAIQKIIRPVNFYKNKSKNISNCAKDIVKNYNSKVPEDINELIKLPGVGRKTANVFLSEVGYDSIGVDTHVSHISQKIGWTKNKNPKKIEEDLKKLFPKRYWAKINLTLVRFGKTHTNKKEKDDLINQVKKVKQSCKT